MTLFSFRDKRWRDRGERGRGKKERGMRNGEAERGGESLSHTQREKFNQQIFLVSQLDSGLRKAFI